MRLETERLVIRLWQDEDRATFAGFSTDPQVRRFYPTVPTIEQTNTAIDRYIAVYERNGFSLLAVERKSDGALIGDVGLLPLAIPLHGNPRVEIGWLLGQQYWGSGYAPEAAGAWLKYAFSVLNLPEIVAFTAVLNHPSQRVMEKLGMTRDLLGDFEHPNVPEGHALRPHVLYRIGNPAT